jgi:hypothetical protein
MRLEQPDALTVWLKVLVPYLSSALAAGVWIACAGRVDPTTTDGCEIVLGINADRSGGTQALRVNAKNVSRRELTLTLAERCPAGLIEIAGLPDGYDVYGTCNTGPCVSGNGMRTYHLAAGVSTELAVALLGVNRACQPPLAAGHYSVSPVAPPNALRLCTVETTIFVNTLPPNPPLQKVAPSEQTPPAPPRPEFPRLPVAKEYACVTSSDCVLVCPEIKGCCGNPCGCSHAMNRAFADDYVRDYSRSCSKPPHCPPMGCAYKPAYGASCREGRCVADNSPGGF